ncbi:hypothetical protein K3148_06905 [Qipengyuania aurantiaca]|uniref:SMODS and SLOG-associating 2TM effector domain-containing protein n=1 Tax=Qipengyuania aurantiaca TaxID=2867233 RepID=A0ABX8ZN60_9SPHN|nr:hypothetical protein [Qipengyuania aurantiaca]QZD88608.1 hypothetical protein K3148_06905 [Qipengyuania aurantiaca]
MSKTDYTSIGAAHRNEAEKNFKRAVATGAALLLAHSLDIQPAEMDAAGLKLKIEDAAILYGAIAMVFVHYASQALRHAETATALFPLRIDAMKIRNTLKIYKKVYLSEKRNRGKPVNYKNIKSSARWGLNFSAFLLLPYYIGVTVITVVSIPFSIFDIYKMLKVLGPQFLEIFI